MEHIILILIGIGIIIAMFLSVIIIFINAFLNDGSIARERKQKKVKRLKKKLKTLEIKDIIKKEKENKIMNENTNLINYEKMMKDFEVEETIEDLRIVDENTDKYSIILSFHRSDDRASFYFSKEGKKNDNKFLIWNFYGFEIYAEDREQAYKLREEYAFKNENIYEKAEADGGMVLKQLSKEKEENNKIYIIMDEDNQLIDNSYFKTEKEAIDYILKNCNLKYAILNKKVL